MLRAQVHVSAAQQKKKEKDKTKGEGASLSTLKAVVEALKRKNDGKDDCPSKKHAVNVEDRSLKSRCSQRLAMGLAKV